MQKKALSLRAEGQQIAFVPTMGYLHEGHLSLIQKARKSVGPDGVVVVSIFVNPTQFGPNEDFAAYPRDEKRDLGLCREKAANIVFIPSREDMYDDAASIIVKETELSSGMEASTRPTHFEGVTTVVSKLFNIVQPTSAVFGQKDFQQAAIIQRLVKDLNMPVKILVAPTLREKDGLAMSSRNAYLTEKQRAQADVLWRSIKAVKAHLKSRAHSNSRTLTRIVTDLIDKQSEARLDYVSFFDPETLKPAGCITSRHHMALAVFFGKTRLIDNARLR